MVEHRLAKARVASSNLVSRFLFRILQLSYDGLSPSGKAQDFDSCSRQFESGWPSFGILAQVVEHLTFNQVVRGSSPRCLRNIWNNKKAVEYGFFVI